MLHCPVNQSKTRIAILPVSFKSFSAPSPVDIVIFLKRANKYNNHIDSFSVNVLEYL